MSIAVFWSMYSGGLAPAAVPVGKMSLPTPPDMERAEFYHLKTSWKPRAVLVLCPGCNDSGEEMVREKEWQDFARKHQLGVLGVSFASSMEVLADWRGYHIASQGSGQALLDAVHQIYGKDLPLVLYGFSSGGLFILQFVDWRPERVLSWCAYASGEGGIQNQKIGPPGIVACGEFDAGRYGAMLSYFKIGRAQGKPWLWVSLPKTDHELSIPLEEFTQTYFSSVLSGKSPTLPIWVDIDREEAIGGEQASDIPSISGWLPRRELLVPWKKLHEP